MLAFGAAVAAVAAAVISGIVAEVIAVPLAVAVVLVEVVRDNALEGHVDFLCNTGNRVVIIWSIWYFRKGFSRFLLV